MKTRRGRFNAYLTILILAVTGLGAGCASAPEAQSDKKKPATTLKFYVETNPDSTDRHMVITVGRNDPFQLVVQDQPFLSEIFVVEANVVDVVGGFQLALKFDGQGGRLLEQYTTSNKSRHLAIFSQFGDARWLAAPLITRGIADGKFQFTPDASREEAERIVAGLQAVAEEVKKEEPFN